MGKEREDAEKQRCEDWGNRECGRGGIYLSFCLLLPRSKLHPSALKPVCGLLKFAEELSRVGNAHQS